MCIKFKTNFTIVAQRSLEQLLQNPNQAKAGSVVNPIIGCPLWIR